MRLQASIVGYGGQGATVVGVLDEQTHVLVIAMHKPYTPHKLAPDIALVSNQELNERDARFDDDQLADAIRAYSDRKSSGTLDIVEAMQRFDPGGKIEAKDITETGRSYQLMAEIDNGCMAVLALCQYADRLGNVNAALADASELADFYFSI